MAEIELDSPALATRRGMRWNWLWYGPFCVWFAFRFWFPSFAADWRLLTFTMHNWAWGVLISPSAYFCYSTALGLIFLPAEAFFMAPALFAAENSRPRRYLVLLVAVVGTLGFMYFGAVIVWGSCPIFWDTRGFEHLRFIPFLPLPRKFPVLGT